MFNIFSGLFFVLLPPLFVLNPGARRREAGVEEKWCDEETNALRCCFLSAAINAASQTRRKKSFIAFESRFLIYQLQRKHNQIWWKRVKRDFFIPIKINWGFFRDRSDPIPQALSMQTHEKLGVSQ